LEPVWRQEARRYSSPEANEPTCSDTISAFGTRGRPGTRRFRPGVCLAKAHAFREEIIYVIEGTLEYQVEGKPTATYKAGDVLLIPSGAIHAAKNVGTVNAAELATYVVEKDKPLITLVK